MRIVVAPGQGSQSEGFLTSWLAEVEGFPAILESYSDFVGLDLIELGTKASEDRIKDTAVAQPLIVASSLAAYRTLFSDTSVDGVAGHSVGEFAAAAIAGVLSDEDALRLVSIRAQAMATAAAQVDTSMAAILGGELDEIQTKLDRLTLHPANFNGSGQLVVAGLSSQIAELIADPPAKARVIELKVAGAFHTAFMDEARSSLSEAAAGVTTNDPSIKLWSNQAGQLISDGKEFLELLVSQVSSPVRWDKVMLSFEGLGAQVIELPPAGALSGLLKRGVEDCRTVPLRNPQDFEKVDQ